MINIKKIQTGITHSGRFHTDDVISTAFLVLMNPNIRIQRVDDFDSSPREDEIVYDIGMGEFDHHQENVPLDKYGNRYCAFARIWDSFGIEFLEEFHVQNKESVFEYIKNNIISKMNQGDNSGYKNVKNFYENDIVLACNCLWFEEEVEDKQFWKAVSLGKILLNNWIREACDATENHTVSY